MSSERWSFAGLTSSAAFGVASGFNSGSALVSSREVCLGLSFAIDLLLKFLLAV
jgi:hypothetical protein